MSVNPYNIKILSKHSIIPSIKWITANLPKPEDCLKRITFRDNRADISWTRCTQMLKKENKWCAFTKQIDSRQRTDGVGRDTSRTHGSPNDVLLHSWMCNRKKKILLLKCVPETSSSSVFVCDSVIINNRDAIRLMNFIRVYLHLDCTLKYLHRVRKYDTELYIYHCYGVIHDRSPIWLAVRGG